MTRNNPQRDPSQTHPTPVFTPQQFRRAAEAVAQSIFTTPDDQLRLQKLSSLHSDAPQLDILFVPPDQPDEPENTFPQLRWGGQVVVLSPELLRLNELAHHYQPRAGFILERGPRQVESNQRNLLPKSKQRWYYLVARRCTLTMPGDTSYRFTFQVELAWSSKHQQYVVLKKVPNYGSVMVRLKEKNPNTPEAVLAERTRKLVDKVFPVLLSREAAFLNILHKRLPASHRQHFPQLLTADKDKDGFVRKLTMSWMRLGTDPINQLAFARQSAQLLDLLHNTGKIIHLDLRMDNIVITNDGVGFIDFGSAVADDEDLTESNLLDTLFNEMMSTSQIQKNLGHMIESGSVTSNTLIQAHQKVDKAADLYYLALQISSPHSNPDLVPLITWNKRAPQHLQIKQLTQSILRPPDPDKPAITTAAQLLTALKSIED